MRLKSLIAPLIVLMLLSAAAGPVAPYEAAKFPAAPNGIDELVFARLKRLGIAPAAPCSDAVFIRRAYLDAIGTLPTAEEVKAFLADDEPHKRSALIDRLLEREEFADYWALKWCDLLRVKSEFPSNVWPNGVQAYHRWLHASISANKPFDQFARELLTASGSNFRDPQVNFYRAMPGRDPRTIARTAALTFMGTRAENWDAAQLDGMARFFAQIGYKPTGEWKEEIVFFDAGRAATRPAAEFSATLPDGATVQLSPERDPRDAFAAWLTAPGNRWFTRNIVNRTWFWLMGRGIVHEPDDIRPDNPPVNAELLALLERELVAAKYDMRHLYRRILNSRTYQLSSIPASDHPEAAANFAHYPVRRLDAEVLIDAICQITGTTESYSSAIPEPFTFIPESQRSIALADGSITSSFLEMFGRPPRDTGLELERNNRPTADQRLHLLNSSHIRKKIEQGSGFRTLLRAGPKRVAPELYLAILSRPPTAEELAMVTAYVKQRTGPTGAREAWLDVAWALINSHEFLCRH